MLKINISRQAKKFLKIKRQPKINKQIANKICELRVNPKPQDSSDLTGYPFKRVDAGEYRIIYIVENDILEILIIGKRNDDEVYKVLKRQF